MESLFNSFEPQVLFQEVPDEVSLAFTITGCKLKCSGCHSQDTWDAKLGSHLSNNKFQAYIDEYKSFITCILFFGGEWSPNILIEKLIIARDQQLKTCLYTGLPKVSQKLQQHLSFLKTGQWKKNLGGLDSPLTNQRFLDLDNNQVINYKFKETESA
ncbi:MAG: anaerobic ribonucleoside-triphosphate reductase activating protein [Glaciecola sp.]